MTTKAMGEGLYKAKYQEGWREGGGELVFILSLTRLEPWY